MGKEYYEFTTMFILARFFAIKQIMVFEGVYSNIEFAYPKLGSSKTGLGVYLQNKFELLERIIDQSTNKPTGTPFFRYFCLQLGESLMLRENGRWLMKQLSDFRNTYYTNTNSQLPDFLQSAKQFVESGDSKTFKSIMDELSEIAQKISKVTLLPTSIP